MKSLINTKHLLLFVSLFTGLSCFLLPSCFKDLTKEKVVYQNDFEINSDSFKVYGYSNGGTVFDLVNQTKIINFNGSKVLGSFNNNRVDFEIDSLPAHNAVRLEFDLNIHDQWRNDSWKYVIDGQNQIVTGFSNDSSVMQAYPNWINNGTNLSPAGANAYNRNLPGLCSWASKPNGTSVYKIVNTYLHSSPSFSVSMSDAVSHFLDTCTLSWSIDNFKVTIINN